MKKNDSIRQQLQILTDSLEKLVTASYDVTSLDVKLKEGAKRLHKKAKENEELMALLLISRTETEAKPKEVNQTKSKIDEIQTEVSRADQYAKKALADALPMKEKG